MGKYAESESESLEFKREYSDTICKEIVSFLNAYTDNNEGEWSKNRPEDISAAQKAIENKKFWDSLSWWKKAFIPPEAIPPMGTRVGDKKLDDYIDSEFSKMKNDESLLHKWRLFNNCKHEAANLIKRACEAQQKDNR